jgi:hypothetical protein
LQGTILTRLTTDSIPLTARLIVDPTKIFGDVFLRSPFVVGFFSSARGLCARTSQLRAPHSSRSDSASRVYVGASGSVTRLCHSVRTARLALTQHERENRDCHTRDEEQFEGPPEEVIDRLLGQAAEIPHPIYR